MAFIVVTLESYTILHEVKKKNSTCKKLMLAECDQNNCFLLNYNVLRIEDSFINIQVHLQSRKIFYYY